MPTATKQPTTPVEPLDLASLTHLNAHPRLAPLISQRVQLRQQLSEISEQVKLLQKDLRDLPAGDSFRVMTQQRTLSDRIAELERQGAAVEEQLRPLWAEVEAVETEVRGEVVPLLTVESIGALERLVAVLEVLDAAQQTYQAVCAQNRHLVGSTILPTGAIDATLRWRLAMCKTQLAKLRERTGVA